MRRTSFSTTLSAAVLACVAAVCVALAGCGSTCTGKERQLLEDLEADPWSGIHFYSNTDDLRQQPRSLRRIGLDGLGDEAVPLLLEFTEAHTLVITPLEAEYGRIGSIFRLTDAGLRQLAEHPSLRYLALSYADITDAGLVELYRTVTLRYVSIYLCHGVTQSGVERLQELRHDLRLEFTGFPAPPVEETEFPE